LECFCYLELEFPCRLDRAWSLPIYQQRSMLLMFSPYICLLRWYRFPGCQKAAGADSMTVWACCFLPFWELKLHSGVRLLLAGSVPVTGKGLSHEAKYIQDIVSKNDSNCYILYRFS